MTRRNPCFDRAPYASTMRIQDGWLLTQHSRVPWMKDSPFRMTPTCVYGNDTSEDALRGRLGAFDPGCQGCSWRTVE